MMKDYLMHCISACGQADTAGTDTGRCIIFQDWRKVKMRLFLLPFDAMLLPRGQWSESESNVQ